MEIRELAISGAWAFTPVQHGDSRGVFLEAFKAPLVAQVIGHDLDVARIVVAVRKLDGVGLHPIRPRARLDERIEQRLQ